MLHLLADVAADLIQDTSDKTSESHVSPVMKEALNLPKVSTMQEKQSNTLDELPDHLSPACIRKLENKNLDKLAEREKKAKQSYLKAKSSGNLTVKKVRGQ